MNNECLPKFVQMDDVSFSIKTAMCRLVKKPLKGG